MAPNVTPGSKKRGRPRKDQSNNDSPVKKPRLTPSNDSRRTAPGSLKSLSSAKSKSLGYGQRKSSTSGSLRNDKDPIDKIYEIPDSDEELKTRGKNLNAISNSPVKRTDGDTNGVYEFQGSDEEPSLAQTPSRSTRTTAPTSHSLSAKHNSTKVSSKASPQVSGRGTRRTAPRASRRKDSGNGEPVEASEDGEGGTDGSSECEDLLNTPSAVRTSNRKGESFSKTNRTKPKLKGILTPSRRLSERNPKSVAFNETDKKTDEIFFADLPNKSVKSSSVSQTQSSDKENVPVDDLNESETLEEEEDVVCVVCSKPESKPPNQILFCDGCDMAVHQKCYGVARIPKDDWLCNDCSQTTAGAIDATGAKASLKVKVSEAVPEIPNFGQHLRSLQRVLLGRCTGKRRIKLCGQDEAYEKTFQLVDQTVMAGEGNSMLIIGARGSGKTTVSSWMVGVLPRDN